jgi:hypothetical protein
MTTVNTGVGRGRKGIPRKPWPGRFWEKVLKTDGCWVWIAARNPLGYGLASVESRTIKAYRVSWELSNGPIPKGLCVLHRCDNPPCVNPDHLFLGTIRDNNIDRQRKGRTKNLDLGPGHYRARTHCPAGHPYDGTNVRFRPDGRRRCAACYAARKARARKEASRARGVVKT